MGLVFRDRLTYDSVLRLLWASEVTWLASMSFLSLRFSYQLSLDGDNRYVSRHIRHLQGWRSIVDYESLFECSRYRNMSM